MKKFSGILLLVMSCAFTPASAFEYRTDFLEPANPGGWTEGLKTFEDAWRLNPGQEIDVDIWLTDVPENLLSAGFWIQIDASKLSIVGDAKMYDGDLDGTQGAASGPCCAGLPGPWDPGSTTQFLEPEDRAGTYLAAVLDFSCVAPDEDGDVIIGRIRLRCHASGNASVAISTIPDFATVGRCVGEVVYDQDIDPITVTITQGTGTSTAHATTTAGPVTTSTTAPFTTTTAQVSTTTTGSDLWQTAYAKLWGARREEKLSLLRSFRERMIATSALGGKYISLFYEHSQEIASMLVGDPRLCAEAAAAVENLLPSIESFMQHNKFVVPQEQRENIANLLGAVEAKASVRLKGIIIDLRHDLQRETWT